MSVSEPPDARTVLPGREVTYHKTSSIAPERAGEVLRMHFIKALVTNVLVGVRARWGRLSVADKQEIVAHLRSIADRIEKAVGGEAP